MESEGFEGLQIIGTRALLYPEILQEVPEEILLNHNGVLLDRYDVRLLIETLNESQKIVLERPEWDTISEATLNAERYKDLENIAFSGAAEEDEKDSFSELVETKEEFPFVPWFDFPKFLEGHLPTSLRQHRVGSDIDREFKIVFLAYLENGSIRRTGR